MQQFCIAKRCCAHYHPWEKLHQHIVRSRRVPLSTKCCRNLQQGWQQAQQRFSTCNLTMLRDKLTENVASITRRYEQIVIKVNIFI